MKIELFLAWRYLFRGKARHISFISIIACLGVAVGVATLVVVISVMNGFDRDLAQKLLRFNYHLVIENFDSSALPELQKKIAEIDDVENVSVFLHTQVFANFDNYIVPLIVKGVDFNNLKEKEIFSRFIIEEYSKQGFFIGEGLKRRFFIQDQLEFYPLEKKLHLEKRPIRGVFKVGLYDIDNNYLICDIEEAKTLSDNYILFLGVRITHPFSVEDIKRKIESLDNSLVVNTWIDMNRALFAALKLEKITMFVILSLIILVAAFTIFSILMVKVVEKTKDIGILKAIGFKSRQILSIFTLQGITLGVIGVVIGVGLGSALCFLLKEYHFINIPQEIYYIEYLPVYIDYRDLLIIAMVSVVLSFLGSFLPARRASKLSVCQALRYE